MPIYEYYCNQCDIRFESIISKNDKPLESYNCPYCESSSERVLSATSSLTGKKRANRESSLESRGAGSIVVLEIDILKIKQEPDKEKAEKILSEKKPYLN